MLSEVFAADVTCVASVFGDRLLVTGSCGLPEDDPAFQPGWPVTGTAAAALASGRPTVRIGRLSPDDLPGSVARAGHRVGGVGAAASRRPGRRPADAVPPARHAVRPVRPGGALVGGAPAVAGRPRARAIGGDRAAGPVRPPAGPPPRPGAAARRGGRRAAPAHRRGPGVDRHRRGGPGAAARPPRPAAGRAATAGSARARRPRRTVRAATPVLRVPVPLAGSPAVVLYVGARAAAAVRPVHPRGDDDLRQLPRRRGRQRRALPGARLAATHDSAHRPGQPGAGRQHLDEALRPARRPDRVGAALLRPRRVQGRQRPARPRGRRRPAAAGRRPAARAASAPTTCWPGSAATSSSSSLDGVNELAEVAEIGRRVARALDEPFAAARRAGPRVREHRRRARRRGSRPPPAPCCATPTPPCTRPRRAAPGLVEVFDDAASHRSLDRLDLRSELLHALDRGQLRLHYQPIFALDTGADPRRSRRCCAGPTRSAARSPPDVFIPLAEETGAIVPIGQWVLHQACRQLGGVAAPCAGSGAQPVTISVNLSAAQLAPAAPGPRAAGQSSGAAGVGPGRRLARGHRAQLPARRRHRVRHRRCARPGCTSRSTTSARRTPT